MKKNILKNPIVNICFCILLLFIFLIYPNISKAEVIFGDHFDNQPDWDGCSDPPAPWADFGYRRDRWCNTATIGGDWPDAHGTSGKSFRIEWPPHGYPMWQLYLPTYAAEGLNDFYTGFWYKHNAGWDFGTDATHKWVYLPETNSGNRNMINYQSRYGAQYGHAIVPDGSTVIVSDIPFDVNDDDWHYVIIYLKHSTGSGNNDGQLRLWWDGVEANWRQRWSPYEDWDNTHINFGSGSTWTSFMAYGYQDRADSETGYSWGLGNTEYYDDIVIATTKEDVERFLGVDVSDEPYCGDDTCDPGETCSSCPNDCGACAPSCGDGTCDPNETCSSCPSDCGTCQPYCGDGTCNGNETCSSCPTDCGQCQGDGSTYYIDATSGNDNRNGLTPATAWRTLSRINNFNFQSGDDVYLKCDETWVGETLQIDWNGTSADRVKIGAYYMDGPSAIPGVRGNKPVIDGDNRLPGPIAPGPIPCGTACHNSLVKVSGNYVDFENIRIINAEGHGIAFSQTNYSNCYNVDTLNIYRAGIAFGEASNGIIEGCDVQGTGQVWPEYCEDNSCTKPAAILSGTSANITIRNNIVHENYGEGIGVFFQSHDNLVEHNTVYANLAAGIYVGWGYNNIFRRNLVYGTTDPRYHRTSSTCQGFNGFGLGIDDEYWHDQPATHSNKIYQNLVAGTCYGILLASNQVDSVFRNNIIDNNIFVDCKYTFRLAPTLTEKSSNSYIRNNVSLCSSGDCDFVSGTTNLPGITWSHNAWSSNPPAAISGVNDVVDNLRLTKTSGWRSLQGGDLTYGAFIPVAGSPVIDAGTNVNLTADYRGNPIPQGNAPDIGAFESEDSESLLPGDANDDGEVTFEDVDECIQHILNPDTHQFPGDGFTNADMDGNGIINILDVQAIVNLILNQ